jgi:hypothetical protein
MQAIGHGILAAKPGAKVLYLTSEQFTNDFINSLEQGSIVKFRKRYRAEARAPVRGNTSIGASATDAIPDPAGFKLEDIWEEEWEKNIFDAAMEKVKHQVNATRCLPGRFKVGQVPEDQLNVIADGRQIGQFTGAEIVQHAHVVSALDERVHESRADEPGSAGDECLHPSHFP